MHFDLARLTRAFFVVLSACTSTTPPSSSPRPDRPAPNDAPHFFPIAGSIASSVKRANHFTLCEATGAIFACHTNKLARVVDDAFVYDPAIERGVDKDRAFVRQVFGAWPDDAWLVMQSYSHGRIDLYRRAGLEWALAKRWAAVDVTHDVLFAWSERKVAAVRTHASGYEIETFGHFNAPIAAAPEKQSPTSESCAFTRVVASNIEMASDGTITVSGYACDDSANKLREKFVPGAKQSIVEAASNTEAVRKVPDGWRVEGERVQRKRGDTWLDVALPPPPSNFGGPNAKQLAALDVWVRERDDVWVLAHVRPKQAGYQSAVLLRSSPSKTFFEFDK